MPSNTNVNNNSAVVVVGRTAPVPTGQQSAAKSIPVVVASDQEAIPVEEQNKQQSEVALSLLGIPRSEVALGIFADVNTYDVNPSEWSAEPVQLKTVLSNERADFAGFQGQQDWGLSHVPAEAGALIEAPATEYSVLTSKRFFRYQPGRVSAGTFGVKFGRSPITTVTSNGDYPDSAANNQVTYMMSELNKQVRHPSIKKYGVFDNFDGYYYESINESRGDNLCCVRRTQSLIQQKSKTFFFDPANANNPKQYGTAQYDDYGNFELPGIYYKYHGDSVILRDGLVNIHAGLFDPSLLKEKREIDIAQINANNSGGEILLDTVEYDISNFEYNNVTGRATVTTVGDHGFKDGDSVTLKDILLSCNTGQKLYPNKYSRKLFQVKSVAGNNVVVNVGQSDYDGTSAFSSTSFSGGQLSETTVLGAGTTRNIVNIDRITGGILEITLDANHDLIEGDLVDFITAVWDNAGSPVNWPNSEAANGYGRQRFYQVRKVKNSKIIQIAIGDAAFSSLPDVATYTSGGTIAPKTYTASNTYDISAVSYNPSTGDLTLNMGSNSSNFSPSEIVELANIQTVCSYNKALGAGSHTAANPVKVYPAKDDEDTFPISNVTSNSFTFELFQSTIVHTYVSGGRVTNLGLRKGSSVYYYKNGRSTNGVDGGIYYVHDIVGPKAKLTLVPTNGDDTSVFSSTKLVPVEFNTDATNDNYKLTASNIVYDATNGNLTVTSNGHGLVTGDKVRFEDFSIGLTCDSVFASTTAYGLGQFVRDQATVDGAKLYKVTVAGTSGASAPTHTSGTATNGSVTFEFVEEFTYSTANVKYYPRPSNSSPAAGLPPLDPASGKFLNVVRINDNQFRIDSVLTTAASSHTYGHTFVYASPNSITVEKTRPYLVTPAPFILPDTINGQYSGTFNAAEPDKVEEWTLNAYGCFPYKYTYGNTTIGYVGTDVAATTSSGAASLRTDIDYVNNNLLKDWIYNHVKPQYWPVYEYRVPRSRFSGEKIDGQTDQEVLYSDVVYSQGSQKFPGEGVVDVATGSGLERTSNWNLNPENVTMYKIEFSWYGAVGALFLAYVPLDSGEARWVRVHHLRASNQLKVSSLGNPTLPITYMVYGGGTERSYGYINSTKQENYIAGSSSRSEFLVKYGASYYIDGGDRGTVRLFNYATPTTESVYGSRLNFNITGPNDYSDGSDASGGGNPDLANVPYLDLTGATVAGSNQLTVTDYTFYMGATVVTPNRDPGIKVIWVDSTNNLVYLNRNLPSAAGGNYSLLLDRPKVLIGLKCREEVNSVRNRIQVYPTRLSIGNSGAFATIKLVKSPVFQTEDVVSGSFTTTYDKGTALNIGSIAKPVALDSTKVQNLGFLSELGSTFGYFRGFYDGDSENEITIFGKLQRDASGVYLFNAYEKTNINLLIFGDFLRSGEFYEPNPTSLSIPGTYAPSDTPLAALSAISISTEQRTPIPGTGQQITTLYTPSNSGEQFELQQFFDYNKDYLSFPLTNEIETLFVLGSESNTYDSGSPATTITAAVTWEEQ